MIDNLLKELKFEDCRALIYDDGTILFSDHYAEHHCYLEKEEVDKLLEELKKLREEQNDKK